MALALARHGTGPAWHWPGAHGASGALRTPFSPGADVGGGRVPRREYSEYPQEYSESAQARRDAEDAAALAELQRRRNAREIRCGPLPLRDNHAVRDTVHVGRRCRSADELRKFKDAIDERAGGSARLGASARPSEIADAAARLFPSLEATGLFWCAWLGVATSRVGRCIRIYPDVCTLAYTHAYTHARMHTRMHARMHARMHTRMHAHMHTG
jgi:hypothetical protein